MHEQQILPLAGVPGLNFGVTMDEVRAHFGSPVAIETEQVRHERFRDMLGENAGELYGSGDGNLIYWTYQDIEAEFHLWADGHRLVRLEVDQDSGYQLFGQPIATAYDQTFLPLLAANGIEILNSYRYWEWVDYTCSHGIEFTTNGGDVGPLSWSIFDFRADWNAVDRTALEKLWSEPKNA